MALAEPILVAADRAGETLSHSLPALNAKSVKEVLEPVVAPDAARLRRQPLLSGSTLLLASGSGALTSETDATRRQR